MIRFDGDARLWSAMLVFAALVLVDVVAHDRPTTPYDLLRDSAEANGWGDGCWKLAGHRVGDEELVTEIVFRKCDEPTGAEKAELSTEEPAEKLVFGPDEPIDYDWMTRDLATDIVAYCDRWPCEATP